MNPQERQAAIVALERKLKLTTERYVLAIRNAKGHIVTTSLYAEVNEIKNEIRRLKDTR